MTPEFTVTIVDTDTNTTATPAKTKLTPMSKAAKIAKAPATQSCQAESQNRRDYIP